MSGTAPKLDLPIRGLGRRDMVRTRINDKERVVFQRAAEIAGLSLSSWARMVMREKAIEALSRAGEKTQL